MDRLGAQPSIIEVITKLHVGELAHDIDWAALADLESELSTVPLPAGKVLFRQGDVADSLYVLTQGRLRISVQAQDGMQQIIDELTPWTTVGELGLLTGHSRSATVQTITDCRLLRLSTAGFDRVSTRHPAAMQQFVQAIIPRLRRTQLAAVLAGVFGNMSWDALHKLQSRLEWRRLAGGDELFRQGDPGDALYIVVSGRLKVIVNDGAGGTRVLSEVSRGESVGEFALLTGAPRSATVVAVRDTELVYLPKATFEQLLDQYPQLMAHVARFMVNRHRLLTI